MKRYVILGGGCSFAVHLAHYLLDHANPEKVVSIVRTIKPECFGEGGYRPDARYYWTQQDVRKLDPLLQALDEFNPHVIINFAAEGESRASFLESCRYFETNCVASSRLVEALQTRSYLNRFVQISTGEVYGSADHPIREDEPTRPTSPYAASKACFDHYLEAMARKRGFRMNIVRPANTYGEFQQLHRFIPKAILFGLTGQRVPLYGSGHGIKSYLHAEDLARAIFMLTEKAPLSRIYNIAPKMPVSMRDIAEIIAKQLALPISSLCEDIGQRQGTDARYWFDSSAAERDFGFVPKIGLEEGITRVVEWVNQYKTELSGLPTEYEMAA